MYRKYTTYPGTTTHFTFLPARDPRVLHIDYFTLLVSFIIYTVQYQYSSTTVLWSSTYDITVPGYILLTVWLW